MNTGELRIAWGPACKVTPARVVLFGGAPITVDYRCKEAFTALSRCLEKHNYPADKSQTGAYNCRPITGGVGYSLHAYGIAVDINWLRNPYGSKLHTDMPAEMVADILALRTGNGQQLFRWGGSYTGNKDAMHFEIVCSPADVATGVADHDPGPVKPDPPRPVPVLEEPPVLVTHPDDHLEMFDVSQGALTQNWEIGAKSGAWSGWKALDKSHPYVKLRGASLRHDGSVNVIVNALDGDWLFWYDGKWSGPVKV